MGRVLDIIKSQIRKHVTYTADNKSIPGPSWQARHCEEVSNQSQKKKPGSGHLHNESTGRDRHSSQQGRTDTLPEATEALHGVCLLEAVAHAVVLHVGTESISLHLTLDNIERVAGDPKRLTGQTTIGSDLESRNIFTLDIVALGILVHHVLKGHEPRSVGGGLTQNSNGLTAEDTLHEALVRGQLADAVNGARVQAAGAVRLRLQTDTHVFDRVRQDRIGNTGERTGHEVLSVGESRIRILFLVHVLEATARLVECAELDTHLRLRLEGHWRRIGRIGTYTGTDTDQRGQSSLVEGEGTLLLEDLGSAIQGTLVLTSGLQADLDDICGV